MRLGSWRTRLVIIGSVLAAAVLGLAGCGSDASTGGGTASLAEYSGAPPNWIFPFVDQAHNNTPNTVQFERLLYRPLYWFGQGDQPSLNAGKSMAELPVYSDNDTKAIVNLKPYHWSNGESVDARDVVFWLNMMAAEKTNWAQYVPGEFPDNVASYSATGPEQVTFTLKGSWSQDWFTGDELEQVTPMPMAWDKTSDKAAAGSGGCTEGVSKCAAVYQYLYNKSKSQSGFATDPLWQVVDGPWRLSKFTLDGSANFVPNPKYSGPDKPHLTEFDELPFTTDASEYDVLRGGNTVTVGQIPLTNAPQRSVQSQSPLPPTNPVAAEGYDLTTQYVWGWMLAPINYGNPTYGPVFRQLYIRQALQETVDQQTDAQVAWRGYAIPTVGAVPTAPRTRYVSPVEARGGTYHFDPNSARDLLTGHGWTLRSGVMTCTNPGTGANQCGAGIRSGLALNLTMEYSSGVKSMDQIMQQWKTDAAKAGVGITLTTQTFNTVTSDTSTCPQKPTTCGWQLAADGYATYPSSDPTGDSLFLPGASGNVSGVADPQLNTLVGTTLHSDQPQAFDQYADYVANQLPGAINLPDSYFVFAYKSNLKGFAPYNPVGSLTPEDWYFTK
jgi:peptide/nickel transport system substrate-binding protein